MNLSLEADIREVVYRPLNSADSFRRTAMIDETVSPMHTTLTTAPCRRTLIPDITPGIPHLTWRIPDEESEGGAEMPAALKVNPHPHQ